MRCANLKDIQTNNRTASTLEKILGRVADGRNSLISLILKALNISSFDTSTKYENDTGYRIVHLQLSLSIILDNNCCSHNENS